MKKLLSWILVLALCLSLFPCVALAEEAEEPVGEIALLYINCTQHIFTQM